MGASRSLPKKDPTPNKPKGWVSQTIHLLSISAPVWHSFAPTQPSLILKLDPPALNTWNSAYKPATGK